MNATRGVMTAQEDKQMTTWTYEGYWNAVLGAARDAACVRREFALFDDAGIDEWLGAAEAEAWREGAHGGPLPDEWGSFHAHALEELRSAGYEVRTYRIESVEVVSKR